MQYEFRDLSKIKNIALDDMPGEGISFGDFDSREQDWWLFSREAPTPTESEIIETIPYHQGEYDFSMLSEERFYKNRKITYKFVHPESSYQNRKGYEEEIKRMTMREYIQTLLDTHDESYYWVGKCESVEVDDDTVKGMLTATLVFNCYPFAYTLHSEGSDIWDDVFFPHWIWQDMSFSVDGKKTISFQNIGSKPIMAYFDNVVGSINVKGVEFDIDLTAKEHDSLVKIMMNENKYELTGTGSFDLVFKREELI